MAETALLYVKLLRKPKYTYRDGDSQPLLFSTFLGEFVPEAGDFDFECSLLLSRSSLRLRFLRGGGLRLRLRLRLLFLDRLRLRLSLRDLNNVEAVLIHL